MDIDLVYWLGVETLPQQLLSPAHSVGTLPAASLGGIGQHKQV